MTRDCPGARPPVRRIPCPYHTHQGIRALEAGAGLSAPFNQVPCPQLFQEVGNDFGVGFRVKAVTPGLEVGNEFPVIFDDAVVHYGKLPGAVGMGMGVGVAGLAMGTRAGVTDTRRPRGGQLGCLSSSRRLSRIPAVLTM